MRLRITTSSETYVATISEWDEGDDETVVYRINRNGFETFYESPRILGESMDFAGLVVRGLAMEALEGAEELEE